jgi:kynurenine formamidase
LHRLVDVPVVVVDVPDGQRAVDVALLEPFDVAERAVLLRTGYGDRYGTPEYVVDAPYLARAGAEWLVAQGVGLVGIDGPNIDDIGDSERPAHTVLLAAAVPVVEHLTGLGELRADGAARFTAAPPMIEGLVSFPVRAFAVVDD